MFPSPLGDYISLIGIAVYQGKSKKKFPSPLGDYISLIHLEIFRNQSVQFPSPLGDYISLMIHREQLELMTWCFRPLSGTIYL